MESIVLESVSKLFRHRPALFNWIGTERVGETRALDQVSLRVSAGQVLVLLGPNGSGKTTTLKLVSTMLLPDSGRVEVQGADTRYSPRRVCSEVGFAIANERSFFPRLSTRENLDFFAALDDVPRKERPHRIAALIDQTGLGDAADTLVMNFSSGMYQKLGIARALLKRPSVLLLDEPTRSLDPASASRFWDLVRELADQGTTVMLATHSFNEAVAVGDSVAVLYRGHLVGKRSVGATSVEKLRAFYFQATGELDDTGPGSGDLRMSIACLFDKTLAIMRRDLLTAVRYRTGFLMTAGGIAAELAAFYYLARAIGPGFRPEGTAYFPFLLVGTGFFTFLMMGTNSFLTSIQEAQQTGTLEVLMTSPTPAPVLVFLSAVSAFARNTFRLLVYFSVGLAVVLSGRLPHPNLPGSLVIFFLSIAVAVAIGILAAAVQLAVQKGSAVVWLLGSVAWCLTGALFPVSALPRPLSALAQFVPLTHSLTGMRQALLQGMGPAGLAREAGILAAFSAVLLPASLLVFSYTLRRARRLGTLSAY